MTRSEIVDRVHQWQEAMAHEELEAHGRLYANPTHVESPLGGSVNDRAGVLRVAEAFFAAFPSASFEFEPPLVDGDRAALVATISGTHVGDLMGLPPSGRSFRFPIAFLLEFQDGLIVRERRVYDFTGLLLQIGVLKAKPT